MTRISSILLTLAFTLVFSTTVPFASTAFAGPKIETDDDRKPRFQVSEAGLLIRNATVFPVSSEKLLNCDVFIKDGLIKAIGKSLKVDDSVPVLDATGYSVMPGIIDCHSHIAARGGLNEMTEKLSPEVRVGETLNPRDIAIYRALAGGVTSALILHGSANPIGGQSQIIKLKYNKTAPDLIFKGAPRTIKFALGENPTRRGNYPKTRQGVMQTIRRCFNEAVKYRQLWQDHNQRLKVGEFTVAPRRDLRLDTYVDILNGDIDVHCHSYRSDEILALIKVADEFGFKIKTFQHVLDGYKIAPEIAAHGAGGSTFSDWWAYKIEATDAIPHNAAVMTASNVVVSINSDSPELIRHLNVEAAKSARYGEMSEREILKMVTLNPAKQMGIAKTVGSLEVGKAADIGLWNGHPLSILSRCQMTLVDGEVYFEDLDQSQFPEAKKAIGTDNNQLHLAPDFSWPDSELAAEITSQLKKYKNKDANVKLFKNVIVRRISAEPMTGDVLIRGQDIAAIGTELEATLSEQDRNSCQIIDGKGRLQLSPGFIDAGTQVGLYEVGSAEETLDYSEVGRYQPDWVALDGVHPHSTIIPVTRLCGTTMTLVTPRGRAWIPGQASLMHLTGDTAEAMSVERSTCLFLNLPKNSRFDKDSEQRKAFDKYWREARDYHERRSKSETVPVDLKLEALRPYVSGTKPVVITVNGAKDIIDAVEWARKAKVKLVIKGGRNSWKIAPYLAKRKIPVILGPVMSVPGGSREAFDSVYRCASVLEQAGVQFAIHSASDSNARILPFEAGMAAGYGLSLRRALRAVTLSPAQILGIDKRVGSIEVGKKADLILTIGHPLQPTSRVLFMLIDGQSVALESRQTRLYEKFMARNAARLKAMKQAK